MMTDNDASSTLARRVAFFLLAGFILLAPAAPQVFGVHAAIFRPWVMFSEVGVGLLKGRFILTRADGRAERLTPLQVLGFSAWPTGLTPGQPHHVLREADLGRVVAAYCGRLKAGERLGFDGYRADRGGWVRLSQPLICAGAG